MKKYLVTVKVVEERTLEVQANSEQDAKDLVMEQGQGKVTDSGGEEYEEVLSIEEDEE